MLPVRVAALDGPGEEGHGSVVSNKYRYGSASGPIATPTLSPKSDREDSCKSGNNSPDRLDVLVHAIGT